MFKGNPRNTESGSRLSFEMVHLFFDQQRMLRLRDAWENQIGNSKENWDDEWIVTQVSSDTMTGLRHEIEVLASLGMLSVKANGKIVLAQGWENKVPHMVLNEMREAWGSRMDIDNLFLIHDRVKKALQGAWEHVEEDGWRLTSDDDNEVIYDDEEYEMRKQIFIENYKTWISENHGMGVFGV